MNVEEKSERARKQEGKKKGRPGGFFFPCALRVLPDAARILSLSPAFPMHSSVCSRRAGSLAAGKDAAVREGGGEMSKERARGEFSPSSSTTERKLLLLPLLLQRFSLAQTALLKVTESRREARERETNVHVSVQMRTRDQTARETRAKGGEGERERFAQAKGE